jgi:hypothetical protein
MALAAPVAWLPGVVAGLNRSPLVPAAERMAPGKFQPAWESLAQYHVPDWSRDAKFGLWAHWGPQCQPEHGDWYAREMYMEGHDRCNFHVRQYGHPSKFGCKDVINEWKAGAWQPDELLALYQKAGAKYFVALANGESIYGTRPWKIFGEGLAPASAPRLSAQSSNEGKGKPCGAQDIRFMTKAKLLNAHALVAGSPQYRAWAALSCWAALEPCASSKQPKA